MYLLPITKWKGRNDRREAAGEAGSRPKRQGREISTEGRSNWEGRGKKSEERFLLFPLAVSSLFLLLFPLHSSAVLSFSLPVTLFSLDMASPP